MKPAKKTDTIVVSCIDYRLQPHLYQAIRETFNCEKPDIVTIAGGAYALTSGDARKQTVMKDIELAISAHGVDKIILLNHQDCGKYQSKGHSFSTVDDERAFHREELSKAAKSASERFGSGIAVLQGFTTISDSGVLIELLES